MVLRLRLVNLQGMCEPPSIGVGASVSLPETVIKGGFKTENDPDQIRWDQNFLKMAPEYMPVQQSLLGAPQHTTEKKLG